MSVLSDVHVVYNDWLDGCAITRFRFNNRELNNENKQKKKVKMENCPEKSGEKSVTDVINLEKVAVNEKEGTKSENFIVEKSEKDQAVNEELKDSSDDKKTKDEQCQSASIIREEGIDCFHTDECSSPNYDSDGDIKLTRKRIHSDSDVEDDQSGLLYITIKHSLATDLEAVGEQVWQGALLLCDFVCERSSEFRGQCVVDLGAGTGLTSIVAAMFADHVFCTDTGDNVLNLASSNIHSATESLQFHQPLCPIHVKELDWFKDYSDSSDSGWLRSKSPYSVSKEDLVAMKQATMFIAADVIYDDEITDAFFSTVKFFMSEPPDKTLYIGLERRLVFTIADLDVSSPCYNHFKQQLNKLVQQDLTSLVKFNFEQIDTDFRQFFQHSRTGYLELWKITSYTEENWKRQKNKEKMT